MTMTKDVTGVKDSSKRLAGLIISGVGLLIMTGVGVCSFFFKLSDPGTAFNSGLALLSVGGGLLGLTIGEYIGQKLGGSK